MAVFSDRIVLKRSTDSEGSIIAAIESGGTDEIVPGELVVGVSAGTAKLYTMDSVNDIVTLGGTAATTLGGLEDVDVTTTPPTNLQSLAYDAVNNKWIPSTPVVGSTTFAGLTDVNTAANGGPNDGDFIVYNALSGQWEASVNLGTLSSLSDTNIPAPADGESLIYDSATGNWLAGIPNIVGLASVQDDTSPQLGGVLDVDGFAITNDNTTFKDIEFQLNQSGSAIAIRHETTGGVVPTGKIEFYSSNSNSPYFTLESPVNSQTSSWTLTFPTDNGSNGESLVTDGAGNTSWVLQRLSEETNPTLNANLNVNGYSIRAPFDDVDFDAGTGIYTFDSSSSATRAATIQLESHPAGTSAGVAAPLSLSTSYVLELPDDNGTGKNGYALVADGSGGTFWSAGLAADLSLSSINALADVDTSTSAPSLNEALVWDGSNWVPGGPAANLSSNTLGQIGDVNVTTQNDNDVLVWDDAASEWVSEQKGIQDAYDYGLEETTAVTFTWAAGSSSTTGQWEQDGTTAIILNNTDSTGENYTNYVNLNTPTTFSISATGAVGTWTSYSITTITSTGSGLRLGSTTAITFPTSTLYLTHETPPTELPLEDGKVLSWSSSQNKFVPVSSSNGTFDYNELQNTPDIPDSINDLSDVDTVSTTPVSGQVLEWDGSYWVPGDGSSVVSVQSINQKSGRVFLGLENLLDVSLLNGPGRESPFNTNINEAGAAYTQEGVWGAANAGFDLLISPISSNGEDLTEFWQGLPTTGSLWVYSSSSGTWNGPASYTDIEINYLSSNAVRIEGVGSLFTSTSGVDIKIAINDPNSSASAKTDGDVVMWNGTTNRYEPTPIDSVSGGTFGSG